MDERRRKPVKKGAPQSGKRPPQPQRSAPAGQRRTGAPVQRNKAPAPRKEPQGGVRRTHIIDGRIPHSILIELLSDEGIGTMFLK